jgi:hypothetical protein
MQQTGKFISSPDDLHQFFVNKPKGHFYKYKSLLSHILLQHMITSKRTLETLKSEHIVGTEILSELVNDQWTQFLANDEQELL